VAPVVGKNVIPFSCLLVSTRLLIGELIHFVLPLLSEARELSLAPVVSCLAALETVARSFHYVEYAFFDLLAGRWFFTSLTDRSPTRNLFCLISLEVHSALWWSVRCCWRLVSEVALTEMLVAESVLISELILIFCQTGAGFLPVSWR
jgi:hypothetical protein